MNRIFKYIFASALLIASLSGVANAQMSDAEKAKAQKSIEVDKWTTPGPVDGSYYLNLETFITGYTSNVTTYETTTISTPLDIVLLLDMSGSMNDSMTGIQNSSKERINALKTAVDNFITTIKNDATTNNVDHRISLIQFNSQSYPNGSTHQVVVTPAVETSYTASNTSGMNTSTTYYVLVNGSYCQVKYCDSQGRTNGNNRSWRYNSSRNTWTTLSNLGNSMIYSSTPVTTNVLDTIVEGYTKGQTQVVKNFRSVQTSETELKSALQSMQADGSTYVNYGINLAKLVFEKGQRSESLKLLVLFTDGVPGQYRGISNFNSTVANETIATSKILKENGVIVYTVGTINMDGATTTEKANVNNYMSYTSSNYPNAQNLSNPGTPAADQKYYANTTDASVLNNVFQTISKETAQEAANANAGYTEATTENNVTVKDIVTSNFVIPADAKGDIDLSKIEIYTAKSTGVTRADNFDYQNYAYNENGYTWAEPELSTLEPAAVKDADTGKTTVSVPGFNFSENWVGWQDKYDGGSRVEAECSLHDGYKLIIKILVEPNPNSIGGEVPTNDPASGLYITKDGVEENLESYPQPDKVLVPMDLNIVMNGIKDRGDKNLYKPGETAIFKITDYAGQSWTVAVTANESGVGTASIKVPFYNDATKDTYKVEEMPEWSYRFNSKADPTIVGNPENSTSISKQLTVENHTFYFVATDTDPLTDGAGNEILDEDGKNSVVSRDFQKFFYDESSKNNVFNSSANPTGTSTTSRKK